MRRQLATSLLLLATALVPRAGQSQSVFDQDRSLAGMREVGIFGSGRVLSTEYSFEEGKTAFGGVFTFGTHLKPILAIQAGMGVNYSRQQYTYYKPPLWTFTPTISLILQRSTAADIQPYGIIGAGYEFIKFTQPRCDCEQSRSLGVGNLGVGVRKMLGSTKAFRAEVSSQIGKGGPAFTGMAGLSVFVGTQGKRAMRPPARPVISPVPARTTVRPASPQAAPAQVPAPPPPAPPPVNPAPANNVMRAPSTSPLPGGVGTVLLSFDGTQIDFTKPTWRDDAEPLLDGLAVDLTSDAGLGIKISVEAHTDNVGSNAANIMLGIDRARAVREYLVSQGVAAERIRVSSQGEDAPVAPNTTAIGRQQNRRIVIKRDN
jgi:outer membrane protein OmpA-like peptidoglycan-associated protein